MSDAAYTRALGNDDHWAWLEEKQTVESLIKGEDCPYPGPYGTEVNELIKSANGDLQKEVPRPELEIMNLAMIGGGRVTCRAQPFDYPWKDLGKATIVDVGGGVGMFNVEIELHALTYLCWDTDCDPGGFCLQLSKLYPDLSFVIQDREKVVNTGKEEVWPKAQPSRIEEGRVEFQAHDFFTENPVKGADLYWIRHIL